MIRPTWGDLVGNGEVEEGGKGLTGMAQRKRGLAGPLRLCSLKGATVAHLEPRVGGSDRCVVSHWQCDHPSFCGPPGLSGRCR